MSLTLYSVFLITSGTFLPDAGLPAAERGIYTGFRQLLPRKINVIMRGTGLRHENMLNALNIARVRTEPNMVFGTQDAHYSDNITNERKLKISGLILGAEYSTILITDPIVAKILGCLDAEERSLYRVTISRQELQFEALMLDPLRHLESHTIM